MTTQRSNASRDRLRSRRLTPHRPWTDRFGNPLPLASLPGFEFYGAIRELEKRTGRRLLAEAWREPWPFVSGLYGAIGDRPGPDFVLGRHHPAQPYSPTNVRWQRRRPLAEAEQPESSRAAKPNDAKEVECRGN